MNKSANGALKFFSGTSHPQLAERIRKYLSLGKSNKIDISRFSCGEIYARINENVRGTDMFLLQTSTHNVNDDLMELLIMVDAAKRASARSVAVVIPHYPYSRQDKKSASREPISARLIADLIVKAGATRVITMDLHADQIQGYFNIPLDHLTAMPLFTEYFKNKKLKDLVVVAPDTGRAKTSKKLADRIGAEIAILHKSRPNHNVSEVINVVGNVKDKTLIIFDDIVDTAGSVTQGLKVLKDLGCRDEIYLATTHAVFSGPSVDRLKKAGFKEIVVTDTIPIPRAGELKNLVILSTDALFGEAIKRNHENASISVLFD